MEIYTQKCRVHNSLKIWCRILLEKEIDKRLKEYCTLNENGSVSEMSESVGREDRVSRRRISTLGQRIECL